MSQYEATLLDAFREVRREMDPGQIFLNEYVRRILHVEDP